MSAKRPIDKILKSFKHTGLTSNQQVETALLSPASPCTVMGIRWSMIVRSQMQGTSPNVLYWAIAIVHDGEVFKLLNTSDQASFYQPEQNVLAFGVVAVDENSPTTVSWEGNTKTMRKLRIGDEIVAGFIGDTSEDMTTQGVVQLFCKS